MARLRDHIGPALFEATFVVFGVVIAYAVNEWREKRVHKQDARAARAAIVRELAHNREATRRSFEYHHYLIDTLRTIVRERGTSSTEVFHRGFTMPAQPGAVAWEVAEQTGTLNHLAFDEVLSFSRLYESQERYEKQAELAGSVIYNELYRVGAPDMASRGGQMLSLISAFCVRETEMLAMYDSLLSLAPNDSLVPPAIRESIKRDAAARSRRTSRAPECFVPRTPARVANASNPTPPTRAP